MNRLSDPQRHDDLLNYRLKRLLLIGGAPAVRLCEGAYGITRTQWRLTAALVEEGPTSPGGLAQRTGFEHAKLSRCIAELAAKGLVARTGIAGDRRRVKLAATDTGVKLYHELFPQLAAINRRIMEALDPYEAQLLDRALAKLMARAQQIYDEGGGVVARTDRRLGGSRRFWAMALD
ncbi:MAG: MarR family transcriptional regulator [Ramlibacter sp.]